MDKMHMIAQFSTSDSHFYFTGDDGEYDKWSNRGDQTGYEANIRNFTDGRGSGGWGHVYRVLDESIREKMAQVQMAQCLNGYAGYNQGVVRKRYKNRGSILRAMCAAQLGIDIHTWAADAASEDSRFDCEYNTAEGAPNYRDGKLNLAKIDLRTLSPWDVAVECGTDCSMSVMAAFNIATNLWRHSCYTPGKSYNRYLDTQPSGTFNMSGGGWQMAKIFKLICAGRETEPVCNSAFKNKTLKCDYVTDEFVPFSDEERIKELGYDLSNFQDAANPGFVQTGITIRHVGFRFGAHDRALTYEFKRNSCYKEDTPNTAEVDANGNRIRQVMYAYGCGVQHSETVYIGIDGTEQAEDDGSGKSRLHVWYTPPMKQYIAASDGKTLLAAQYDSYGNLTGWKDEATNIMPWQSTLHCRTWDGEPMTNVYASALDLYKAYVKGDTTVSPIRRVSAKKFVRPRNYTGTVGDWSALAAVDPSRLYCLIGGYTASPMSYDLTDTTKTGTRAGWSTNYETGTFSRKTKHYMYYRRGYNASVDADLTGDSCYMKVLPLKSSDGTTTVWAYFASDGNKSTSKRRGNVCWIQVDGEPDANDDVFPFFKVSEIDVNSSGSFLFGDNKMFTFPSEFTVAYDPDVESAKNGYMYYYFVAESTGTIYQHWKHSYQDDEGQTVTENFVQDWKVQSTTPGVLPPEEGSEESDPNLEYVIVWRKQLADGTWTDKETEYDESTGTTVQVDIKPPFGDGATEDESDGENGGDIEAINGSLLYAISSPVNLERGDILLTRAGTERTAASSGGHMAMYI